MPNLLIYGGTFDPPHKGHIQTAINVQNHFEFDRFMFLPSKIPLLKKQPHASDKQRVEMLKICLSPYKKFHFEINLSEIERDGPSYMVTTLKDFRQKYGKNLPMTLLMGIDVFAQLPKWYKWQELLNLANILIIERSNFEENLCSEELLDFLKQHQTEEAKAIKKRANGLICRFDAGSYPYSSTWVREQLLAGESLEGCLPKTLRDFIKQQELYSKGKETGFNG